MCLMVLGGLTSTIKKTYYPTLTILKEKSNNIVCSYSLMVVSTQVLGVPRVMESLPIEGLQVVGPFSMAVKDPIGSFLVEA